MKDKGLLIDLGLGFTLLELIVAVAIGGILMAGGLAAYKGTGERQNLKQAGLEFITNLRAVQKKALSGEKPVGCVGSLESFQISYVNETEYCFQAQCSSFSPEAEMVSLAEGARFLAGFSPITFPVLKSELSGSQSIVLSSESFSYQVVIESGGTISGDYYEE